MKAIFFILLKQTRSISVEKKQKIAIKTKLKKMLYANISESLIPRNGNAMKISTKFIAQDTAIWIMSICRAINNSTIIV